MKPDRGAKRRMAVPLGAKAPYKLLKYALAAVVPMLAVTFVGVSVHGEDAQYDPIGKRDPFQAPAIVSPVNQCAPEQPLLCFDLGQMKLKGTITGVAAPKAVVQLPDGKGIIVRIGDRIGKYDSRVRTIRRDEVVVVGTNETESALKLEE